MSPEAIEKTRAAWLGRKHSDSTREKISEARRGKPGRKLTPEESLARSVAIKAAFERKRAQGWVKPAYQHNAEAREKIRAGRIGKRHTPEALAKMSASKRARDKDLGPRA
jgi:hypothetical protein